MGTGAGRGNTEFCKLEVNVLNSSHMLPRPQLKFKAGFEGFSGAKGQNRWRKSKYPSTDNAMVVTSSRSMACHAELKCRI